MKFCCIFSFFLISITNGRQLPDPFRGLENIADEVIQGADNLGQGVMESLSPAAKIVGNVDKAILGGINGGLNKGIFKVEKGIVNKLTEVIGTPVNIQDVQFFLATVENFKNPVKVDYANPAEVADTTKHVFFITHGWTASRNDSWVGNLTEVLLMRYPGSHVVQVDWSKPANNEYPLSSFNTENVGEILSNFTQNLVYNHSVPIENIVLIGHSLGAQISGFAGRKFKKATGKKLPLIVGLDPAGPLFCLRPEHRRLNKNDAKRVMVIHTDGGQLGFLEPCGTIDFFPNGGSFQPGCAKINVIDPASYLNPCILGNIFSTVSDVSSKVASVADSAIGGTLTTIQEITGRPVNLNEIKFYLFTNENPDEPLLVNPLNPISLVGHIEKIFFLIHGRQQNSNSPWMKNLSKSLLKTYPGCKVVHVDWRGPANQEYPLAVFNTESVGKHVADLLKRISTDQFVPTRNIILIGFSLGSQVCGFTGKYFAQLTGTKLPRIIALDPAGVLFVLRPEAKRLNPDDATVVQVIHTDGGKIGLTQPCGTVDFYPNGGKDQPGCPHVDGFSINDSGERLRLLSLRNVGKFVFSVNCDHERTYQYFIESVENYGSFAAKQCTNFEELGRKACSGKIVAMGDLDVTETGIFYLETNSYAPFSKESTDESLISALFGGEGQIDIRIQK